MVCTAIVVVAAVGLALLVPLSLVLFATGPPYRVGGLRAVDLASRSFLRMLSAVAGGEAHRGGRIEVLANGEVFYEEELRAIRGARTSVNLEAYIYDRGEVGRRFRDALAERARAGVRVNVVLDAIGSFATGRRFFRELTEAGGRVFWYHPFRWHTLPRLNNRTHRELVIVDGRVAYLGGAGIGDRWRFPHRGQRRWRDTMFRVEGPAVTSLQAAFTENWVETSGEILIGEEYFPPTPKVGDILSIVVASSPTTGGSTRGRMLYQTLIACARRSICITTPYFVPDRGVRAELVHAVRDRGVAVRILVPGRHTDQYLTRRSSRRLYGKLLRAGAEIFEYTPTMIHVKTLVVDGLWCVVGSANLDNRSFGLNDEVALAARDAKLAARLLEAFAEDLRDSEAVSYRRWRLRPVTERAHEWLGSLLEKQQ